ncbi:hypothetical protein IW140_001934 [Coemansia sp. RSA 1813]|nr:hypothetical protein EV178_001584 [Coemansia sp. RSA 1646]KAJ1771648.1 hypothetical protein LPJ74_002203 [Coemansia sp. RSA 1843]KAJ2089950.1 hypothetical protein IW138_003080 [Coemansia sp. RSA 986]KAJ2215267.1 hypothetical protein EV179_002355 [Coemansia sp. RSA 487]KAJ2570980.1 hypothetical protein IW140_001934 [Coemansia sp. RSA 1813]
MSDITETSSDELPPLTWRSWMVLVMFIIATGFVIYPLRIPLVYPVVGAKPSNPETIECSSAVPAQKKKYALQWRVVRIHMDMKLAPWIAILILLASTTIKFVNEVVHGFVGSDGIEPYAIVILIFALAYICISLDQSGLLSYIAMHVTKRWGQNGRLLLVCFYLLSTVMAVLTSNDVVVLCLTPIICIFSDVTGADAEPFLIAMFVSANTASMALYIGNPTNIIASQANGIAFLQYSAWMALPFLGAVVAGGAILYIQCFSKVPRAIEIDLGIQPRSMLVRPRQAIFGAVILALCLITLSVSSFFGVAVWIVTLPFGGVMLVVDAFVDLYLTRSSAAAIDTSTETETAAAAISASDASNMLRIDGSPGTIDEKQSSSQIMPISTEIQDSVAQTHELNEQTSTAKYSTTNGKMHRLKATAVRVLGVLVRRLPTVSAVLSRLPYNIVPFSIGMFILVESLSEQGWTPRLSWLLKHMCPSVAPAVFIVGAVTALACNIMNNLPMTIIFTRALKHQIFAQVGASTRRGALFALIVGSNLGANFTLVGSLAGLMFQGIARQKKRDIGYFKFLRWCLPILPIQLAVACAILTAEVIIMK